MNFRDVSQATLSRPRWAFAGAIVAALFGALTVWSGGRELFGGAAARAEVGNAVGFVLWFNFLCGFFYVLAGIGLFLWKRWAAPLAAAIAIITLFVFVAFGLHVAAGGAFEMRTVWAMTLRSGVWIAIAILACRALGCSTTRSRGGSATDCDMQAWWRSSANSVPSRSPPWEHGVPRRGSPQIAAHL